MNNTIKKVPKNILLEIWKCQHFIQENLNPLVYGDRILDNDKKQLIRDSRNRASHCEVLISSFLKE